MSSNLADNLDHPLGPMLYAVSTMCSLPASLATNGGALGAMWGEERAHQMLAEAGFAPVTVCKLSGNAGRNCFVARRT